MQLPLCRGPRPVSDLSHTIYRLVPLRDLVPVDVLEELRDVVLAPAVVRRERIIRHVADDERVSPHPNPAVVGVHHRVVPAVDVRVVHEHRPRLRLERTPGEVGGPGLHRPDVLVHVLLDVAGHLHLRWRQVAEVELVQDDAVRGGDLGTAQVSVAAGVQVSILELLFDLLQPLHLVDVLGMTRFELRPREEAGKLRMRQRHDGTWLTPGTALEQAFCREPGLFRQRRGAKSFGDEGAGDRRAGDEEPAAGQRVVHVLLPSGFDPHHGKATVKPAEPPHVSAPGPIPWRIPRSNERLCRGAPTSMSQIAPTRALLSARLPRTASPFTSATARRRPRSGCSRMRPQMAPGSPSTVSTRPPPLT